MLHKTVLRFLALCAVAAACPCLYLAAQDAPSVAEAARRDRQRKEAAASKPTKVITNDTIPSVPVDTGAPAAGSDASPADATAPGASPDKQASAEEDAKKKAAIEALKKQVKEKEENVNLLQREIALEQDTYYGKPDYQHDIAGKQKLDSMRSDLSNQQSELADLKAKLTDLAGPDALKEPAPPAKPPEAPGQTKEP